MSLRTFALLASVGMVSGSLVAAPYSWINDGSRTEARLSVEQAIWAMGKLPRDGKVWSLEEKIARIAGARFDGFMVFLPGSTAEQDRYRELAKKHGLAITLQCAPGSVAELEIALHAVQRMKARGLVAMVQPTFVTFEEGAEKIRGMMAAAKRAAVPFYLETHRGTITQDLLLTGRWAEEIPGLQFHADLSHFVISYEIGREPRGRIRQVFDAVLSRAGMIDGRVGNGEQVQIDIGPRGENPHARLFAGWWKQAMVSWLEKAVPGDIFVFKSELGPPPGYSIVGPDGKELSDRWEQAIIMRDLGIRTWNEAVKEAGRGQPYGAKKPSSVVSPELIARALGVKESGIPVLRGASFRIGEFHLAGQPLQPDFVIAKQKGIKTVINVRMDRELAGLGFDEQRAVEGLGLRYVHIPVGPSNLDDRLAETFLKAMKEASKPVLLHGSNGNRVWGLWALHVGVEHGIPVDRTAEVARKHGIKKLVVDDFVRAYLAKRRDRRQAR